MPSIPAATGAAIGDGLDGIRAPLVRARHVPGNIYTSPEILEVEKQRIFLRDWLCVGRVEEIAEPGDYMTFRLAGEPLIVARNENGDINAFSNVCRHRGVEVAEGAGNAKEFSCPYHGWTYDLNGDLLGAPFTRGVEGFDRAACALKPVRVDTWGGFLFVNFDAAAESLNDFIGAIGASLDHLQTDRCRLWQKFVIKLGCNWKLAPENLADWYHLEVLHKTNYTPADAVRFELFERGGYTVDYLSGPLAPNGESQFGPIPWFADRATTYAFSFFQRPNLNFFARIDEFLTMVAWPTGPDSCEHWGYILFPEEWFGEPDFERRAQAYSDWITVFLQEDVDMVGSLQRGLKSERFEPGPMVGLEKPIHHMLNHHIDRVFATDE